MLNAIREIQGRALAEASRHCYLLFLTATFDEESLPMAPPVPPGELLPMQEKARLKLVDKEYKRGYLTPREEQAGELLLKAYDEGLPARPTLMRKRWNRFVSSVNKVFAKHGLGPVRLLAAGEYGETFARPHYHAVVYAPAVAPEWLMQVLRECWKDGFLDVELVQKDAAAFHYVSRDVVKTPMERLLYAAVGIERPAVIFPRKPELGGDVANTSTRALKLHYDLGGAEGLERAIVAGVGRTFRCRGRMWRHSYRTWEKVLETVDDLRDSELAKDYALQALEQKEMEYRMTVASSEDYCPEFDAAWSKDLKARKVRAGLARKRHARSLAEKRGRNSGKKETSNA